MSIHRRNRILALLGLILLIIGNMPLAAAGEVKPITDMEDKLEGISEEEKEVLEVLFRTEQEIDKTKKEEAAINSKIDDLEGQIKDLEFKIEKKQQDYDLQLDILKQVLVNYQRGGPASYLEILLGAKDLGVFLKSMNIIKDISHNVNDLLLSLEDGKAALLQEKDKLAEKTQLLEAQQEELLANILTQEELKKEQEIYLASLLEEREHYEEQLNNIRQLWTDCQVLFQDIVKDVTSIIEAGYFTMEDLNLDFGFFAVEGYMEEDTFNQILKEHATLTDTIFYYEDEKVILEVPQRHLVLSGNFVIDGKSSIRYEIEEGSFYGMPLEEASIEELFQNGPILIDFDLIAGDMDILDFEISEVYSTEDSLNFVIIPKF